MVTMVPGTTFRRAQSGRSLFLRRFSANRTALAGGILTAVMVLLAIAGPLLVPADPLAVAAEDRLQGPSAAHLFGTDNYGRDLLARVVHGAATSLGTAFAIALITSLLGLAVGLYAGYNRMVDAVVMRIADGLMAFPAILLAIAIMAALGPRTENVVIALTVVFVPYIARVVRSSVLTIREQTFVEALQAQGASTSRIIWLNIAPNVLSPLIVQATFIFADTIITEAALSFLGAGIPPPAPSWGNILLDGKIVIYTAWWMTVFPGIAILLTVLGVNLLGDGLRDLLDPRYAKAVK
ncbi:ABC transporter permease [Pseudonocardia sp. DSM 110487]|nr:ABC transporter permease [Pseudonocardia sp. DSM 110487]